MSLFPSKRNRALLAAALAVLALLGTGLFRWRHERWRHERWRHERWRHERWRHEGTIALPSPSLPIPPLPAPTLPPGAPPVTASALATWPWPKAPNSTPHRGVTHWLASDADGTTADLLCFDFGVNPGLRFELYSQDEDDATPYDNKSRYSALGVGQATRHLNDRFQASGHERFQADGHGQVVAAWNGPFFGYYADPAYAFHVAPIVLRGKAYYTRTNHRWTFGVKLRGGKPVFKVFFLPGRATLEKEFDFAGGSVQCLIKEGKPLKLQPFPRPGQAFLPQPVPSTPQEAGHIPYFDHAKFSRASLAWSRDNQKLYLLVVREPVSDSEGASILALRQGRPQSGGWTVADVQRFWLAMMKQGRVWNAINSDAGDAGQLTYLLPDDRYMLIAPGAGFGYVHRVFEATFPGAPTAGALMYFYVRDAATP